MTIYHILLVKYKPEVTAEQKQGWVTRLIQLGKSIPAVKAVNTGKKIPGTYDKGWDDGAVLLFDSAEDLQAYLPHADHLAFIAQGSELIADATVYDIDTSES